MASDTSLLEQKVAAVAPDAADKIYDAIGRAMDNDDQRGAYKDILRVIVDEIIER